MPLIKTLKTLRSVTMDAFRNLREFLKFLTDLRAETRKDLRLLDNYQRIFVSSGLEIALPNFKVDYDSDEKTPTKKPRKKSGTKIDKIVLKGVRQLTNNFSIIERLSERLELLRSFEAQLEYHFQQDRKRGTALKAIKADIRDIQKAIKQAYAFVNDIAKKNIPKSFQNIIDSIKDTVTEMLWERYENSQERLLIDTSSRDDGEVIRFTYYLNLQNLVNDSDYTYKEYWIAVIFEAYGSSETVDVEYSIDTSLSFQTPNRIRGTKFSTSNEAIEIVEDMLAADSFADVLVDTPLALKPSDIKLTSSHNFIRDLDVTDSYIEVKFNSKVLKRNFKEVFEKVFTELRQAVGTDVRIRYRTEKEGRLYKVRFVLVPPLGSAAEKLQLDRTQLRQIADMWNLNAEQVREFQRALQRLKD